MCGERDYRKVKYEYILAHPQRLNFVCLLRYVRTCNNFEVLFFRFSVISKNQSEKKIISVLYRFLSKRDNVIKHWIFFFFRGIRTHIHSFTRSVLNFYLDWHSNALRIEFDWNETFILPFGHIVMHIKFDCIFFYVFCQQTYRMDIEWKR